MVGLGFSCFPGCGRPESPLASGQNLWRRCAAFVGRISGATMRLDRRRGEFFFPAIVLLPSCAGSSSPVFRGVGLDLRTVPRHRFQLHQTHLPGQLHDLDEQLAERFQVRLAEAVDGARVRPITRCRRARGHVLDQLGERPPAHARRRATASGPPTRRSDR